MPRKATTKKAQAKKKAEPQMGIEDLIGVTDAPQPKVETPKEEEPKEELYRAEWNERVAGTLRHCSIVLRKVGDEYFDKIGKFDVPSSAVLFKV